jgi:thioredoxin 2
MDRTTMSDTQIFVRCMNCLILNRVPQDKLVGDPLCGSCKSVLKVPREITSTTRDKIDREIAYWPETLLLSFSAPACVYCRIYEPVLAELVGRHAGRLKVLKVDAEEEQFLTDRFKVEKTPTYIVYKSGKMVLRMDGAPKDRAALVSWVENLINYQSF